MKLLVKFGHNFWVISAPILGTKMYDFVADIVWGRKCVGDENVGIQIVDWWEVRQLEIVKM